MKRLKKITRDDRRAGIKRALARTDEEKQKRLVKRMGRMSVSPRTFVGKHFIQRNDPCYCGNTHAGVYLLDETGEPLLDSEGEKIEKPVKFKNCCWAKHAGKQGTRLTPAEKEFVEKQDKYFAKKQGRTENAEHK